MLRCKSVVRLGVTVESLGWASVWCFILLPAPSPGTLWPATMKSSRSAETGWWQLRSPGAATTWWTPPSGSQVCVLHLQHVRRKCVKVNSSAATQPEHEALWFSTVKLNRITVWTEAWSVVLLTGSCRNDACFEPSQVPVEETRISGGTDSDTTPELHPVDVRPFSLVTLLLHLLCLLHQQLLFLSQ